jgi:hypothetical protein
LIAHAPAAATKAAADKLSAAKEPVAKAPAGIDPKVALKEKAAAEISRRALELE